MEPIPSIFASIPGDGLLDPDLEGGDGVPVELDIGLVGVDRIALVMPMPIGDVGDQGLGLTELLQDDLHDLDVGFLVMASEVIHLADPSFLQYGQDAPAVILDIEPIPDVQPLPIDGKGFILLRLGDHQGDQFLRELIGAIVVGAPADGDRKPIGAVVGKRQ